MNLYSLNVWTPSVNLQRSEPWPHEVQTRSDAIGPTSNRTPGATGLACRVGGFDFSALSPGLRWAVRFGSSHGKPQEVKGSVPCPKVTWTMITLHLSRPTSRRGLAFLLPKKRGRRGWRTQRIKGQPSGSSFRSWRHWRECSPRVSG